MNKAANKSAFFLALMLLSILLVGIAFAESNERIVVWKVIDPEIDVETLLDETSESHLLKAMSESLSGKLLIPKLMWKHCWMKHSIGKQAIQYRKSVKNRGNIAAASGS